jgi:hypothetical protein
MRRNVIYEYNPAVTYTAKDKDEYLAIRNNEGLDISFMGLLYAAVAISVSVSIFFIIVGIPFWLVTEGPQAYQNYCWRRKQEKERREYEERVRLRELKEEEELRLWRDQWKRGQS